MSQFETLWKARITTHDGENEYAEDMYISGAENEEEAMTEARYRAARWYDSEDPAPPCTNWGENCKDCWEEQHGYRIIELEGVIKVSNLRELLGTLFVVDCTFRASNG